MLSFFISGIYIGWRCPEFKHDCQRVNIKSRCFCDHPLSEHDKFTGDFYFLFFISVLLCVWAFFKLVSCMVYSSDIQWRHTQRAGASLLKLCSSVQMEYDGFLVCILHCACYSISLLYIPHKGGMGHGHVVVVVKPTNKKATDYWVIAFLKHQPFIFNFNFWIAFPLSRCK